jgi:hypothetical protein
MSTTHHVSSNRTAGRAPDVLRLLRSGGFEVEDIIELYADPSDTTRYTYMTAEWAAQWPVEEVWRARLRA